MNAAQPAILSYNASELISREVAMPELPEVETVVRHLQPHLPGLRVVSVHARRRRLRLPIPRTALPRLIGQSFLSVRRRGKWIVLNLQRHCLLVHLGMTGRLQLLPADHPPEGHTHLIIGLAPAALQLRYTDPRRFGAVGLFTPAQAKDFLESQLGPEPFAISVSDFYRRLQSTSRPIKLALMDQHLIAGLGNIYADESLHQARLLPWIPANQLTRVEANHLLQAIQTVLRRAIACHGSTIRDYLFGTNGRGSYQNEFLVYGRQNQPCRRCHQPIAHCRLAGRASYYCPSCQLPQLTST